MSEPAALTAWRRRAQPGQNQPRHPPLTRVLAAGAIAVACVMVGTRVRNPAPTAAPTTGALGCPTVTAPMHADVDGDGCDQEVSFSDGVLSAGAVRMRVGGPDDQIALGRWTCGPVTLALLRPVTGEVFRFDGWATHDNPMSAVAVGRVEGAVGLRAAPRQSGRCDDIAVTRTTGPPVLLPD